MEIDKIIHEPARLRIMMILSGLEQADFNFLVTTLSLSKAKSQIPAIKLRKKVTKLWFNIGKILMLFDNLGNRDKC